MQCKMCEATTNDTFCSRCAKQLETHIGFKCTFCNSFGFVDPTPKNIARLEFFIPDFEKRINLCDVCVIPMNGCPDCYQEREQAKTGAPIF